MLNLNKCTKTKPKPKPTLTCKSKKVKSKVNLDICKAPLNTIAFSKALRYGNMATWQHSFTCKRAIPAFTPQPQSINALWLVLILPPTEGRRLSLLRWLVTYRNKVSVYPLHYYGAVIISRVCITLLCWREIKTENMSVTVCCLPPQIAFW